jgi:hypothetical protein
MCVHDACGTVLAEGRKAVLVTVDRRAWAELI